MIRDDPAFLRTEPGDAAAEAGQVLLDGLEGVVLAMTPDAAEETGRRLIAAAHAARQQGQT